MDFNKLVETLYEWEEVTVNITAYTSLYYISNEHKRIDKADVYDYGVEIMYSDGSSFWFKKNNVKRITYDDFIIKIEFIDGDKITYECN